jgi:SAM-dependent methyltransferase
MSFAVSADAYDRYIGRYSRELAPRLADFAGVEPGLRALDVGCGAGALTNELARRLGAGAVAAADPSEELAGACRERIAGADVRVAPAERLPWPDETFDVALAQLVVNFMADARAGVSEMARVVRAGGTLAACTWDYAEGMTMLRTFWDAALALDPEAPDESHMPFAQPEELDGLWRETGLADVATSALEVEVAYSDFDDYWKPFLSGIGPGGAYCVSLDHERRAALEQECRIRLGDPAGGFTLAARAWAVRGRR